MPLTDAELRSIMGKEPWVPDRLTKLGELYRERRMVYGDTDKRFGAIMKGLFPKAVTLETEDDWGRMALLLHMVNKLHRYCMAFSRGESHVDSTSDLAVYSIMLQQMDDEVTDDESERLVPRRDPKYCLVDVDHVVSDARWRDDMIRDVNDGKITWDDYHAPGIEDPPFKHAIAMVNSLAKEGYKIVGLTSRPEKWREDTLCWFAEHGMHADELLMRPHDNHQPSPDLKIDLALKRFGACLHGVEVLIDDRADVCSRFRPHGILCLQVHVHNKGEEEC